MIYCDSRELPLFMPSPFVVTHREKSCIARQQHRGANCKVAVSPTNVQFPATSLNISLSQARLA